MLVLIYASKLLPLPSHLVFLCINRSRSLLAKMPPLPGHRSELFLLFFMSNKVFIYQSPPFLKSIKNYVSTKSKVVNG